MPLVALLADDGLIGRTARFCLAQDGLAVLEAETPEDLLGVSGRTRPTLAVAMISLLPDPVATSRDLFPSGIPLLLLSGQPLDPHAETSYLREGADDVVVAPFHPSVFQSRVEALLRRATRWQVTRRLEFDRLVVDLDDRIAWVGGRALDLTRTEFDLLAALMSRPLHIQTRRELAEQIGLRTEDASVAPHLSRLRRKVTEAGGPHIGQAIRGIGLRLTSTYRAPSVTAGFSAPMTTAPMATTQDPTAAPPEPSTGPDPATGSRSGPEFR